MKKFLSIVLALTMMLSLCSFASAEDYSGYTIRIYSNSNSTERTTWLIQEAKDAGFTISIDDNSVISGDTAAIQAANENKAFTRTSSSLTGLPPGPPRSASTPIPARPTASSSRTF